MKIAVVVSRSYGPWDERSALLCHFVGALACVGRVDVLVGEGRARSTEADGALTREIFPAVPPVAGRLDALEFLVFGPRMSPRARCGCDDFADALLAEDVPAELEEAFVSALGGDSPALLEHLVASDYDLVVFAGVDTASAVAGVRVVAGRTPTMLLPLALPGPRLRLRSVRDVFGTVDRVVVSSAFEASLAASAGARRVVNVGTVLRVHDLAYRNEPALFDDRAVVVAGDWTSGRLSADFVFTVRRLNQDLGAGAFVRLVGPGWETLPDDVRATRVSSRLDVWRWMARCLAVWDPNPHALLGREVLEAMQYATPVITAAHGAAQEHAERGDGGLWYRTYSELLECIGALAGDDDLRKTLGAQGQAYAVANFADTDAYIARVAELVDEVVTTFDVDQ